MNGYEAETGATCEFCGKHFAYNFEKEPNRKYCFRGCEIEKTRLQAKVKELEDGAFAAREEAQIRNDQIEQLEGEKKGLKVIEDKSWDLRCIDEPTGGDDYDIAWIVIEHFMAEPKERQIGYGKTPLEAIDQALQGKQKKEEDAR